MKTINWAENLVWFRFGFARSDYRGGTRELSNLRSWASRGKNQPKHKCWPQPVQPFELSWRKAESHQISKPSSSPVMTQNLTYHGWMPLCGQVCNGSLRFWPASRLWETHRWLPCLHVRTAISEPALVASECPPRLWKQSTQKTTLKKKIHHLMINLTESFERRWEILSPLSKATQNWFFKGA